MKYTRTALGLLTRQYRSVLKKCWMINVGLFAFALSAQAAQQTATSYDDLLAKLAASPTADVLLNMNGAGITISGNGFTIGENQTVSLKNIGTAGSSSWTNGSGTDYEHRTPSEYFIKNNGGTLSLNNIIINDAYIKFVPGDIYQKGLIRNYNNAHITEIKDVTFNNVYISGSNSMGGLFTNYSDYDNHPDYVATIDLIKNVTAKDITIVTDGGAPHGGFMENYVGSHVGTIDNLHVENMTMRTADSSAGGNHGVIDNQVTSTIDKITNSQFINNYLYRPGGADTDTNHHATAAGIYNQGVIGELSNTLFQGNHTGIEWDGANSSAGVLFNFANHDNVDNRPKRGRIDKMVNVQFIDNYIEVTGAGYGGALHSTSSGPTSDAPCIYAAYIGEMTDINFQGNYIHSGKNGFGGALNSEETTINTITGKFSQNYIKSDSYAAIGGAIYNAGYSYSDEQIIYGNIGSIVADFIDNHVEGNLGAYGGAIYNGNYSGSSTLVMSSITSITKKEHGFSGNYAKANTLGRRATGGAIDSVRSTINSINADFSSNYALSVGRADGGAISVNKRSTINNISGNFSNNYAKSTGTELADEATTVALGGAIYNTGNIKKINGDFTSNRVESAGKLARGGAIMNNYSDEYSLGIDEVTGTYQNNQALATNFYGLAQGGAIYNGKNTTIKIKDSKFIANNATSTGVYSQAQGGTIYNMGNISDINNTTFNDNYVKSEQSRESTLSGGAITTLKGEDSFDSYTGLAKITNSKFTHSYVQNYAGAYGGAISAGEGLIGDIVGTSFSQNFAESSTSFAYGGAIKNSGIVNSLGGSFSDNRVLAKTYARGGAIYNERNSGDSVSLIFSNNDTANIKSLSANFTENYAKATNYSAFGGAIYNTALIGAVSGTFNGNYAKSTNSYAAGGAVYIGHVALTQGDTTTLYNSRISSFSGDFNNNYAQGTNAIGGAIYNNGTLSIDSITGNFVSNRALANTEYAYGGAIYNIGESANGLTATIGNITGTFTANSAEGQTYARGGAIYNGESTNITIKDSTFNSNLASTVSNTASDVQGGAIYNSGTITFKGTNNFSGNIIGYTAYQNSLPVSMSEANGIYNIGTINLDGNAILNSTDGIDGLGGIINAASGSKININANNLRGNTVNLNNAQIQLGYNSIAGNNPYGNISLSGLNTTSSGGSVYTNNGTTAVSYLGTTNLAGDLHYKLDINAGTKATDTLNTTTINNSATRNVIIDSFNELGSTSLASITDENYKIQILYAPNDKIQLALSQDAQNQLGTIRLIDSEMTGSTMELVAPNTNWGKIYMEHDTYLDTYGSLGLATTTTTNDSIGMNTFTSTRTEDISRGDTLRLVAADTDNENKTFTATTEYPNYVLGGSGAVTVNKNLEVSGLGKTSSTLNLNGNDGFNVSSGSSLNLHDLTLTNGVGTDYSQRTPTDIIIYNSGTLTVDKVKFDNIYAKFGGDYSQAVGVIQNDGGHVTGITNTDFTNIYIKNHWGGFGGAIANRNNGTIDLIQNVTIKDILWTPDNLAPHGGAIHNNNYGHIGTIDNVVMQNIQMITRTPTSADDSAAGGGNHSIVDNQANATIDKIINSQFINNYIYKPGEYDVTVAYGGNNHASAAGIYNQGNIGLVQNVLFKDNHTKMDAIKDDVSTGGGGGAAIMTFMGATTAVIEDYIGIDKIDDVQFIHNYVENYSAANSGGAISSGAGRIGSITNAYFEGNYASSVAGSAFGGALRNSGYIGEVAGDFKSNYVKSNESAAFGGAVYNDNYYTTAYQSLSEMGYIKSITGDFTENYTSGALNSLGGAIMNRGKIDTITGDFIGNHSYSSAFQARGGAIYNGINNSSSTLISELGSITAKDKGFKENYTYSVAQSAFGGAVYNSQGNIESIDADFTGNYAQSDATTYKASGGAIYNNSTIDDITGDFSSNYTLAVDYAAGGAINNNNLGEIGTINGNFSDNYAKSTGTGVSEDDSTYARGGAIFNAGHIEKITGDFSSNKAESAGIEAKGGAIYQIYANEDSLGIDEVSGTFTSNGAKNTNASGVARGGAIYNDVNMAITVKDSTFTYNYASNYNTGKDNVQGGAIYNAGNLTFKGTNTFSDNQVAFNNNGASTIYSNDIHNTGTIALYDNSVVNLNSSLSGENGIINMGNNSRLNLRKHINTNTGNTINLNNAYLNILKPMSGILNQDIVLNGLNTTANGGTLDTVDDLIQDVNAGTVNLAGDLHYKLDINQDNKKADTITATSVNASSTGKVIIDSFNVLGSTPFASIVAEDYKIRILYTPSDKLQLALSTNAQNQLGGEHEIKHKTTDITPDTIKANTTWGEAYKIHTTVTYTYGKIDLATTSTTNDSIGMKITRTEDITTDTSLGDTLYLVNADTTHADKTFTATAENPNYTSTSNLTATKGNLLVSGMGAATSTLNLNGKTGFNIESGNSLTLKDLTLTSNNGNSTLTNGATLGLNGVTINNSIVFTNTGTANLSGNNTLNTAVGGNSGTTNINGGTTTLGAAMTQNNLMIASGATLNTNADNLIITNTISDNGTLQLTGGTLSQSVNGSGALNLTGNVTLAANKNISVNTLNLGTSKLTVNNTANNAINVSAFTNSGASGLDTANSSIQTSSLGAVNLVGNLNYTLDFNVGAQTADTLTATSVNASSVGKVMIDSFNVFGSTSFASITDEDYKVRILNTPSDKLQLALSQTALEQLGDERETKVDITDVTPDTIKADTSWDHEYKLHTTYTHTYGKLGLATTSTTNDSIGMYKTRDEDVVVDTTLGDTLRLVADDTTNPNKTFTATAEHPNYTVGEGSANLEVKGNLNITGVDSDTSTLDLADSTFVLNNGATLGLNDLTAVTSREQLITGNGSVDASDANLNGNILIDASNYHINLTDTTLNGSIDSVNQSENVDTTLNTQNATINGDINLTNSQNINLKNTALTGNINSYAGNQLINLSGTTDLNGTINQHAAEGQIDVISDNAQISMLENTFAEANLQAANTTFNLDNDTLENYTFKRLKDDPENPFSNVYNIDFDVTNQLADKITVSADSAAVITIDNLNIINGSFDNLPHDMTGKEFMVQILNAQNDNVQLALTNHARSQLPTENYEMGRQTFNRDDVLVADVKWSDIFYHKTQDEVFYGNIGLADTNTKNDSIGLTLTGSYMDEIVVHEPLGDTLKLLNINTEFSDKTFTTDNPYATYNAYDNMGMTYGNLYISGATEDFNKSTIDLQGHDGFVVPEDATVTIKDANLTNSGGNSNIRVLQGGKMTLDNSSMNNISISVDGHLDITNSLINVKNSSFGSDAVLSLRVNTLDDHGLFVTDYVTVTDKAHLQVSLADNLVKIGEQADIQLLSSNNNNFADFDDAFDNNSYYFTRKNDDGWYNIRLIRGARDLVRDNGGSLTEQEAAAAWVDSFKPNKSELEKQLITAAQTDAKNFINNLSALAPSEAPVVQAVEASNNGLFSMISSHLRSAEHITAPAPYNQYPQYYRPQYQNRPVYYRQPYNNQQYYRPNYEGEGYTYGLSSGDLANPAAIWLNAYKGKAKYDNNERKSFDADKTGILAAVEKQFTAFTAGVGYSYESDKVKAFKRDVDAEAHRVFAYAEYQPNNFFINGSVSYGLSQYKEKKNVFDKSIAASYDVNTVAAQAVMGYETRYFTPEIGVRSYFIKRDAYTDEVGQNVEANDMSIVRGVAGVRAGFDINNGGRRILRPEFYVGLSYDLVGDSDEAVITLPNGETYNLYGQSLDKLGIETGVGLTADLTSRFSLNAQYLGDFRDKYNAHTGMISMKYKF